MIASYPDSPPRLAPFLAQWDYVTEQLFARLENLSDEELLWEPAPGSWTVRPDSNKETRPTSEGGGWWNPTADVEPPRTLAWSLGHLGSGTLIRADWLVGPTGCDRARPGPSLPMPRWGFWNRDSVPGDPD